MNEFYVIIDQDNNAICIDRETDQKDLVINIHAALNDETERAILVNIEEGTTIQATEDVARIWIRSNDTWQFEPEGEVSYSNIPQFVIEHVNDLEEILIDIENDHEFEKQHIKQCSMPR